MTMNILQSSSASRRFMCVVLMKSMVEVSDLHKYVENNDKSERAVIIGWKPINMYPEFLKCHVL